MRIVQFVGRFNKWPVAFARKNRFTGSDSSQFIERSNLSPLHQFLAKLKNGEIRAPKSGSSPEDKKKMKKWRSNEIRKVAQGMEGPEADELNPDLFVCEVQGTSIRLQCKTKKEGEKTLVQVFKVNKRVEKGNKQHVVLEYEWKDKDQLPDNVRRVPSRRTPLDENRFDESEKKYQPIGNEHDSDEEKKDGDEDMPDRESSQSVEPSSEHGHPPELSLAVTLAIEAMRRSDERQRMEEQASKQHKHDQSNKHKNN